MGAFASSILVREKKIYVGGKYRMNEVIVSNLALKTYKLKNCLQPAVIAVD